jgi:hypothetical protein
LKKKTGRSELFWERKLQRRAAILPPSRGELLIETIVWGRDFPTLGMIHLPA